MQTIQVMHYEESPTGALMQVRHNVPSEYLAPVARHHGLPALTIADVHVVSGFAGPITVAPNGDNDAGVWARETARLTR